MKENEKKGIDLIIVPSRRDFIRAMGVIAGGSLLGCGGPAPRPGDGNGDPGNGDPGNGDPGNGDPGNGNGGNGDLAVRPNVASADGQAMIEIYRAGVEAMKNKPASDPTSWQAQAQIHQDWCPHGNAYFLPWHRGYLHYFEQLIRAAAEDDSFALPYWDWTTQPALPDAFWQGSLNDTTRRIQPGQEVPAQFVGPQVIAAIMAIDDWQTFGSAYVTPGCSPSPLPQRAGCGSGRLEATPHNNVHTAVGGRTPPFGNMSTFVSPLDPIFWLHHCNVDRLWATWNLRHANGDDATWRAFEFEDNFVDANGDPQSIRVEDTFDTADLGYRYDSIPAVAPESEIGSGAATVVATAEAASPAAAPEGATSHLVLNLSDEVRQAMAGLTGGPAPEGAGNRTARLTVGGIDHPHLGVPVNVYVGPDSPPTAGADSPGYVGSVTFFPLDGDHSGSHSFLFDIGEVLGGGSFDPAGPLHVHVEAGAIDTGPAPEAESPSISPSLVRLEIVEHG